MITKFNNFINESINKLISEKDYKEYLLKLINNYGNKKRAKESLDDYLYDINNLQSNGGTLYRLVFLENIKDLRTDDLGEYWTVYKDDISRYYHNIEVEDEDVKPYLITGEFEKDSIDIESSIGQFVELPDEYEINIKKQPINFTIKPYKKPSF